MKGTDSCISNAADARVGRIVDEYLGRLAAGSAELEQELLARHPDHAHDIREHLQLARHLRGRRDDHPTADQVLALVRRRMPEVSRTTVYRVLDTLVGVGVLTKVCHPGVAARYDPKTHQHHHLVCLQCNRVIDLEDERLNRVKLPEVATQGFEVRDFEIQFRGVCGDCRGQGSNERRTAMASASRAGKKKSATRVKQ